MPLTFNSQLTADNYLTSFTLILTANNMPTEYLSDPESFLKEMMFSLDSPTLMILKSLSKSLVWILKLTQSKPKKPSFLSTLKMKSILMINLLVNLTSLKAFLLFPMDPLNIFLKPKVGTLDQFSAFLLTVKTVLVELLAKTLFLSKINYKKLLKMTLNMVM
jgi:hypothetical protein